MAGKKVCEIAEELNLETDWVIYEMENLGIQVTKEDSLISEQDEHRYIDFKYEDIKKQQARYDEIQKARQETWDRLEQNRKKNAA